MAVLRVFKTQCAQPMLLVVDPVTIEMDDVIDDLFDTIKGELIDLIRHDPDNGEQAIDLLMIAKYFERIGDHAQNIAEWAEYSITGVHKGAEL